MPDPVDRLQAIGIALAAEARLGQLPQYVRETFIEMLVRGEPIPSLPGEMGFRESDWLDRWEALL